MIWVNAIGLIFSRYQIADIEKEFDYLTFTSQGSISIVDKFQFHNLNLPCAAPKIGMDYA